MKDCDFGRPYVHEWSSSRLAPCPPTISKHCAIYRTDLTDHIRGALPRRFCELAVFDARLYIRIRRIDEPV